MSRTPRSDLERNIDETVGQYMDHVDATLGFYMKATLGDVVEASAQGSVVKDMRGEEWLDALAFMGVFGLGHRNARVIKAVKAQLDLMPMNARYFFNKPQAQLAARLVKLAPGGRVKNVFFSNSGSEAVDVALKCARFATKRSEIISTVESYHGMTIGAVSVSGMAHFRDGIEPLLPGVKFVKYGSIEEMERAISGTTAAVILEPIHAGLGSVVPPKGYFERVGALCDQHGALLIADEVQTGLGRTGKMWGMDHHPGVAPDIITMGKVLSGGVIPIGATLYSGKVADALSERLIFNTSTFGGNELACVAGLAALEEIEEERLVARSAESGRYFGDALGKLRARYPKLIKEIRGVGLMWTLEVTDPLVLFYVFPSMIREHRILIAPHINRVDMMRVSPPMNITTADLDRVVKALGESFEAFTGLDEPTRQAYSYAFTKAVRQSFSHDIVEASGLKAQAR